MDLDKLMGWSLQQLRAAFPVKDCDVKLCMFQFDDLHQAGRGKGLKGDAITGNSVFHCNVLVLRVLGLWQVTCRIYLEFLFLSLPAASLHTMACLFISLRL